MAARGKKQKFGIKTEEWMGLWGQAKQLKAEKAESKHENPSL